MMLGLSEPARRISVLSLCNVEPDPNTGSGYVIMETIRGLEHRGVSVTLLNAAGGLRSVRGRELRVSVRMLVKGARKVASARFDVVEFWGCEGWMLLAGLRLVFGRDVKVLWHSNGVELNADRYAFQPSRGIRGWYRKATRGIFFPWFMRNVDMAVCVSEFDRSFLIDSCEVAPSRTLVIPNGVPEQYHDLPPTAEKGKEILFCGPWTWRKGSDVVGRDLPTFLDKYGDWKLNVVAEEGNAREIVECFRTCIDRVKLHAPMPRDRLIKLYDSCTFVIVPSRYESFGLVIVEAMARGAAVIATRTGIAESLKCGEDLFILHDLSAGCLAARLEELVVRRDKVLAVMQLARARAREFRWEIACDAKQRLLSDLVY